MIAVASDATIAGTARRYKPMNHSYVYVLSNASMPGLLKIGRTSRSPIDRAKELGTTGVPTPFHLEYFLAVENSVDAEAIIHRALEKKGVRPSKSREFFQLSISEARAIIESVFEPDVNAGQNIDEVSALRSEYLSVNMPWGRTISQEEAWSLGEVLANIANRGFPFAMKQGALVYDSIYKWASRYRSFSRAYLEMRLMELMSVVSTSEARTAKSELGKDVGDYLDTLFCNDWLTDEDFTFVTSVLVSGDQFVYEGYVDRIERAGFPQAIRERASNV